MADTLTEAPPASPVEPSPARHRWPQVLPLLGPLLGTLVLAAAGDLALDMSVRKGLDRPVWQDPFSHRPGIFFLGTAVVWLVVLLVQALVGRLAVTAAVTTIVVGVVFVADYEKLTFRAEPVYPSDLRFAGDPSFLSGQIGGRTVVLFVVGAVAAIALCGGALWLSAWLRTRHAVLRSPLSRRTSRLVRVVTALACVLSLAYLSGFNRPGNLAREAYDHNGATWSEWNQQVNYSLNGFVGGVLYNMPVPAMQKPAGYDRAAMQRIVAKYTALADQMNRGRSTHALDDVNVVSVLSEAFTDPTRINGITLKNDPIPYTRSVMQHTTSGEMLAQGFGGGTANMEFEVLTGMSMSEFAPQLSTAYQSLVPHYSSFPSAVGWFKGHGHEAVAVHPFVPSMYRRSEVYPTFGFDRFIDESGMHERHKIDDSVVIDDQSAFDEVTRQIDSHQRPLLVNLVTMQNHMPYHDLYHDPVTVRGPGGGRLSALGQYVRGLEHSDEALRSFLGKLAASKEKTVVVFYGDHLSAAYPHQLFGLNDRRHMYETPFFVWSNFSAPTHPSPAVEPTTSPWYFMNLVFRQAGAAVPPYYALLEALHRQVPAMDSGEFIDSTNHGEQERDLSPAARSVLSDYRMVQYDLSVGHRYSLDRLFYDASSAHR